MRTLPSLCRWGALSRSRFPDPSSSTQPTCSGAQLRRRQLRANAANGGLRGWRLSADLICRVDDESSNSRTPTSRYKRLHDYFPIPKGIVRRGALTAAICPLCNGHSSAGFYRTLCGACMQTLTPRAFHNWGGDDHGSTTSNGNSHHRFSTHHASCITVQLASWPFKTHSTPPPIDLPSLLSSRNPSPAFRLPAEILPRPHLSNVRHSAKAVVQYHKYSGYHPLSVLGGEVLSRRNLR